MRLRLVLSLEWSIDFRFCLVSVVSHPSPTSISSLAALRPKEVAGTEPVVSRLFIPPHSPFLSSQPRPSAVPNGMNVGKEVSEAVGRGWTTERVD